MEQSDTTAAPDTTPPRLTPEQRSDALAMMGGIAYAATFVPYSLSRSAKDAKAWKKSAPLDHPPMKNFNWTVLITRKNVTIETPYSHGVGLVPHPVVGGKTFHPQLLRSERHEYEKAMEIGVETGKYPSSVRGNHWAMSPVPQPSLLDVLHSLWSERMANEYTFEEFCREYDMDDDSITAKRTYDTCVEFAIKLGRMFSDDEMKQLDRIFEDY